MAIRVVTLVVDLDNTLFDWLTDWYAPFIAARDQVVSWLGDEKSADQAIRRIHRESGTTECEHLLQSIKAGGSLPFAEAIEQPVIQASAALSLYPGVLNALKRVRSLGANVYVCTESMRRHAVPRIHRSGLDGIVNAVFCRADGPLPVSVGTPDARLERTEVHVLPSNRSKPDPEILLHVLRTANAPAATAVYVGDSLARDIKMADAAGIRGIYAKYGDTSGRAEMDCLRRISHWSDEEIAAAGTGERPKDGMLALVHGFDEIFDHLRFEGDA